MEEKRLFCVFFFGFLNSIHLFAFTCDQNIGRLCADGYRDGCLEDPTQKNGYLLFFHDCIKIGEEEQEKKQLPCSMEIARVCEEDMMDACLFTKQRSEKHVCILKTP